MKARLIRFLFALHRWSGVVLGLLMLLWCLSGFVMIWSPYPSTTLGTHDYRAEGLAPIRLPADIKLPDIPAQARLSSLRMEMLADRPVISLAWNGESRGDNGRGLFDLSTGETVTKISKDEALNVARTYAQRIGISGQPAIKMLADKPDEFTVGMRGGSLWQAKLNDAEDTTLYISEANGQVRQRTTASLRFWTWLGAIPHWLYFTELRKDGKLWGQVIIWTSLAGAFLTVLGLFVGLRQLRRRHSTGKLASPYRGSKFWHHMIGLVFGILVLTWVFSGFTSMQPWGWLESGPEAGKAVDRLTGEPPTWDQAKPTIEMQAAALRGSSAEVTQVSLSQLTTGSGFMWRFADGTRKRVGAAGEPAFFDGAAQKRAASLLAGDGAAYRMDLMTAGDAYYYPGAAASDFPVLRITVPSQNDTRFYLDPDSGDVRFVADPGARDFRWWHLLPHRLDVMGSPLREIVEMLLLAGVTAVCGLGAWIGIKKLARGGKLDNLPTE
ncbi:MAG TPA: PepSY domain-containing protein [Hyphomonadaceae bacterium]|nr:PepSY domain-containing protein [Hyphomonadaceae bacterium]